MSKILSLQDIKNYIPIRKDESHKGNYGKILILGGSRRFTGAPCICASACMRSGSGLVTLAVENDIFLTISQKLNEVMVLDIENYKDDFETLVKTADCIAIGCGMEKRKYTLDKLIYCLNNSSCPIVVDADGINVLSENMDIFENYKNKIILTPHEGEFSRLSKLDINCIQKDKEKIATDFAKKYNIILVLKGKETVITDGNITYISNIGVPAMATGGMGDCLTGMIASFIGQKISILNAVSSAVYLHSYIARNLSKNMYSVLASDIIQNIPYTINDILYS